MLEGEQDNGTALILERSLENEDEEIAMIKPRKDQDSKINSHLNQLV